MIQNITEYDMQVLHSVPSFVQSYIDEYEQNHHGSFPSFYDVLSHYKAGFTIKIGKVFVGWWGFDEDLRFSVTDMLEDIYENMSDCA